MNETRQIRHTDSPANDSDLFIFAFWPVRVDYEWTEDIQQFDITKSIRFCVYLTDLNINC